MATNHPADATAPKLQKPGAGLPWWEGWIARYLVFPWVCRLQSWAAAGQRFQDEGARVLAVWDALPQNRLEQRVLVPRFQGMEDSSRYWSAVLTVEHLTEVGNAICQVIRQLRQGEVPSATPRIEDFKPKGTVGVNEIRAGFVRLLTEAAASDRSEPPIPRGTGPRYAHPWFGPIDAHQWHCLLGMHQGIHRRQIEAIARGLGVRV